MKMRSFQEHELPMNDLETIGLASRGQLLLNEDDLDALLSGRRTDMLHLKNLEAENIKISALDAKISLKRNAEGKLDLLIHPIYKKPVTPDFLDDNEALELEKGDVQMLWKKVKDGKGREKEFLVEYDAETREFIISDTEKITPPDMVNSEFLTAAQKENYKKGKEVTTADGTTFQYSGKDVHGIRSDKLMLIASIVIDGGLTYALYKGLHAIAGKERDEAKARQQSPGFKSAWNDMQEQQRERAQVEHDTHRSHTR
jgi:hypothetical protein